MGAGGAFRRARQGGSLLLTAVLMLGTLVLLNVLAGQRGARWDWTAGQRFSLSPQSRQVVAGLTGPIRFLAFLPTSDPRQDDLIRLFEEYHHASSQVSWEFIDPDRRPGDAARYNIKEYGVLVIDGGRRESVRTLNEEGITNAIIRCRRDRQPLIAFLYGHGEPDAVGSDPGGLGAATSALRNAGYRPRRLSLLAEERLPDSLDAVIVAGPRAELLPQEEAVLDGYLEKGGRLCVMVDPHPGAGLAGWLDRWGVVVGADRVIDPSPRGRLVGLDSSTPVVTRYEDSPVTRGFRIGTYFPLARSVGLPPTLPKGARGWVLFNSTASAWAETGPADTAPRLDPGQDRLGPLALAVAVDHSGRGGARLVVFGDSDFATNRHWRLPGNGDLFLNAVAWLTERGDEVAVRAATLPERRVELDSRQARAVFLLGVLLVPLVPALVGWAYAWRRRAL